MGTKAARNRAETVGLGLLGGLLIAALGFGQENAQAALLDANCPGPPTSSIDVIGDDRLAQTFTALNTGTVVQAQAEIGKTGPGADFQLQILGVGGSGTPVDGILASATIPDASVPIGNSTLSATFQSPASVTAGQRYALVATRPNSGLVVRDRFPDPCPGEEWVSTSQSGPFTTAEPGYDVVYSIFVNPTNDFSIGKLKRRKLTLTVPGPGAIAVTDAGGGGKQAIAAAKKLLKTSNATAAAAGPVTVKLRLTKSAKARLRERGKLKAKAAVSFTPTGGEANTVRAKLKFK
jgi:hypothetical protein